MNDLLLQKNKIVGIYDQIQCKPPSKVLKPSEDLS